MIIRDVAPDRSCYRPGETAHITVTVEHAGPAPTRGVLRLALTHLATAISEQEVEVALVPGLTTAGISLALPAAAPRGYGLDVTLFDERRHPIAEGSGALDVLQRWSQAPRYGFVADFPPGMEAGEISARADALCRYHLNVVQFYDWMWRHYRLLPPTEAFTDALGRALSLA
ncbi:MAG: hypothetical protein C4346_10010, partial [Chloroflexota bacterium]